MSRARLIAFSLVLMSALGALRSADAGELVVVWLEDGRMLAGEVDPRTNNERLWLRSASPTFIVATSAVWEHIQAVNANGTTLSVDEFSKRVDEFRPQENVANALPAPTRESIANETMAVTRSIPQRNAATRVASLDVEARLANWDQDADDDGVEIRVLPRNTFGEIVPVSGQITGALLARSRLPAHDPQAFPQLGRWSLQADTSDFGAYGAVYRLPFRGSYPDEGLSLEPHGLVEVSIHVSGQGRFESDATICLRQFNPVRRDMQQARQRKR
ncbi:MAG: hypothetical protein WD070_08335 [Pirellulaceae bacterium]